MPNIKSIRFNGCSLYSPSYLTIFSNLANLEALSIDGISRMTTLPPIVKTLAVSEISLERLTIGNSIESLRCFSACSAPTNWRKVYNLPKLTSLELEGCDIQSLSLSDLPRSLNRVKIHQCSLKKIDRGTKNMQWPSGLEILDLSGNCLDDHSAVHFGGSLPSSLSLLNLSRNEFNDLYLLGPLPDTLEIFEVLDNRIESYTSSTMESDSSHFFSSPMLRNLSFSVFSPVLEDGTVDLPASIDFPKSLASLRIEPCSGAALYHFNFPQSLTSLSLRGAELSSWPLEEDLWDCPLNVSSLFYKRRMDNLRDLELMHTDIRGLNDWIPPPTLRKLDLSWNSMERLSSKWPLFNKKFVGHLQCLHHLVISNNILSEIDDDLHLPPNLAILDLGYNALRSFEFTDGFLGNGSLSTLNLSHNVIWDIKVCTSKQASLYELNLYRQGFGWRPGDTQNLPEGLMSSNELYVELEKIGLEPITKRERFESLHRLRPMNSGTLAADFSFLALS